MEEALRIHQLAEAEAAHLEQRIAWLGHLSAIVGEEIEAIRASLALAA